MHAVRMPFFQATMQDRFEVVLRHVDDERIARLVGKQIGAHRRPRYVGRPLDIADLIDNSIAAGAQTVAILFTSMSEQR